MPLSNRDQLKVHVLASIADRGLTLKEARVEVQQLTKMAQELHEKTSTGPYEWWKVIPGLDKALDVGAEGVKKLTSMGLGYGIPALALGPAAVGAYGGRLAAKVTDVDDDDIEAQKKRELIALYNAERQQLELRPEST